MAVKRESAVEEILNTDRHGYFGWQLLTVGTSRLAIAVKHDKGLYSSMSIRGS
jgi:hypothetical protein